VFHFVGPIIITLLLSHYTYVRLWLPHDVWAQVARAFTVAVILIPNMAKAWIARGGAACHSQTTHRGDISPQITRITDKVYNTYIW
jgi:hypothetical protein